MQEKNIAMKTFEIGEEYNERKWVEQNMNDKRVPTKGAQKK